MKDTKKYKNKQESNLNQNKVTARFKTLLPVVNYADNTEDDEAGGNTEDDEAGGNAQAAESGGNDENISEYLGKRNSFDLSYYKFLLRRFSEQTVDLSYHELFLRKFPGQTVEQCLYSLKLEKQKSKKLKNFINISSNENDKELKKLKKELKEKDKEFEEIVQFTSCKIKKEKNIQKEMWEKLAEIQKKYKEKKEAENIQKEMWEKLAEIQKKYKEKSEIKTMFHYKEQENKEKIEELQKNLNKQFKELEEKQREVEEIQQDVCHKLEKLAQIDTEIKYLQKEHDKFNMYNIDNLKAAEFCNDLPIEDNFSTVAVCGEAFIDVIEGS